MAFVDNVVGNAASVTIYTQNNTPQGTYYFRVTYDGAQSAAGASIGTLTVGAPPKSVTIGTQDRIPVFNSAGLALYTVTTVSMQGTIPAGRFTITWYTTAAATTTTTAPAGVTFTPNNFVDHNNLTSFDFMTTAATPAGTYYFKITIDGVVSSNVGVFTVTAVGARSITVGTQVGTLTATVAGNVTFPVTTANIAAGTYEGATAPVFNTAIAGVSVQRLVINADGTGTLTLQGNTSTVQGNYNRTIILGGTPATTSTQFTVSITPAPDPGNGTAANPFKVATVDDLQRVGTGDYKNGPWRLDAHYIQTAHINLSGVANWTPIGAADRIFTGTYDGDGYTISNLKINSSYDSRSLGYCRRSSAPLEN